MKSELLMAMIPWFILSSGVTDILIEGPRPDNLIAIGIGLLGAGFTLGWYTTQRHERARPTDGCTPNRAIIHEVVNGEDKTVIFTGYVDLDDLD